MSWFDAITGFSEKDYRETQRRLQVADGKLLGAGGKEYSVGRLETPTLGELRERTKTAPSGSPTRLSIVQADVRKLHSEAGSQGALFQVASQFNLLEMVSWHVSPEDGVSRYEVDKTQGPACAMAAGAATIWRNYLYEFPDGHRGQTADRQVDFLEDLGQALGNGLGRLWTMRNGYSIFTEAGLDEVDRRLAAASEPERDALRSLLRIGLHWDVDVTDRDPPHAVSQAFCSALPVSYNRVGGPANRWRGFATLVLEAAYEATLRAGLLNAQRGRSHTVYLTRLGGGAFGNDTRWIHAAMKRSFEVAVSWGLDVRVVSYGRPDADLLSLAAS